MNELIERLAASLSALPARLRYLVIAMVIVLVLLPVLLLSGAGGMLFGPSVLSN
ncbi:hypothetical protein [Massilia horti]|uniref:hypothetical protein n=1 Tax=Massilia horti TaxID=2562153 RepID=UPI0014321EF4|nr:hypothetical protein [Massilia horti]